MRNYPVKIAHSLDLRGNGEGEEHIEVLLPADEGVVGAAEGNKAQTAEVDHHGGELHLLFVVNLVDVAAESYVAIAFAVCKRLQQSVVSVPEKRRSFA